MKLKKQREEQEKEAKEREKELNKKLRQEKAEHQKMLQQVRLPASCVDFSHHHLHAVARGSSFTATCTQMKEQYDRDMSELQKARGADKQLMEEKIIGLQKSQAQQVLPCAICSSSCCPVVLPCLSLAAAARL